MPLACLGAEWQTVLSLDLARVVFDKLKTLVNAFSPLNDGV